MITCRLCNKKFALITNTHLKKHYFTIKKYADIYGKNGVGFKISVVNLSKNDSRYINWRKSLFNRSPVWNKGKTKSTDLRLTKLAETLKNRGVDNLKAWRIKARKEGIYPYIKHESIKHSVNLAFLIGMILGDGHIQKLERVESIRITLGTDKPLLWQYTAKILKSIFNKEPHLYFPETSNCAVLGIYRKGLSNCLGVPIGSRKNLEIRLPNWIMQDNKYLTNCLRGLFEAEGSFSIHKPTYTYNFQFSNKNFSLLNEVESALVRLGFQPERRENSVRLRKKKEVFEFKNLINFRKFV
jgi:hypothetical protein